MSAIDNPPAAPAKTSANGTPASVATDRPPAQTNGHGAPAVAARATAAALRTAVSMPGDFYFDEVRAQPRTTGAATATPSLGPLAAFTGDWQGHGFNTIFRPDNSVTPTPLPHPFPASDNVLELNFTSETLSFSPPLGNVPNRGRVQGDAFLNGVPYLQSISDVTTGQSIGIHLEPGLWVIVPPTTDPEEGSTLVRMASIPHGTTINAQGTFQAFSGAPTIAPVSITPFIEGQPSHTIPFPSQQAANAETPRIPQDLGPFLSSGQITQQILDDPNTLLRDAIAGQHITETTVIIISTNPSPPLFGGGTDNIAFLWGNPGAVSSPNPTNQNAQSVQMTAVFWIEQVQHTITVPPWHPGDPPLSLQPDSSGGPSHLVPTFLVRPPVPIPQPHPITFSSPQIQYTQTVLLNFATLSWPHVSVATLVPAAPVPVPPSAWAGVSP